MGRRRDMINLPVPAEIGEGLKREVRTAVGCQGLGHAKVSEPKAKNLDDGGRICRASEVGEKRPSRQTISVGQVLPSLTQQDVGPEALKREWGGGGSDPRPGEAPWVGRPRASGTEGTTGSGCQGHW